jgi:acetylornithine deacetylase
MSKDNLNKFQKDAIELLINLIATPSFSKEEDITADIITRFLEEHGAETMCSGNNVYSLNKHFDKDKPTILLNSHHDTVKPNQQYTRNPFKAEIEDGRLYGLGSNDAGGALASLIATFLYFNPTPDLKYNIVLAATAEEEISGVNGIEALLQSKGFLQSVHVQNKEFNQWSGIVGEPTGMQMAIAEKGLMVLDCRAYGKAGHAARNEGENAIYKAMKDIEWLRAYQFPKVSDLLGPVKLSVTVINTENKAHNVVPPECSFVVDARVNELYEFEEVIEILRVNLKSEIKPRSTRLRSTSISQDHPLVKAGLSLGRTSYGSPTTSDKALMPFPALKLGPGDSARSHIADEYIYVDEIKNGIELYIALLKKCLL